MPSGDGRRLSCPANKIKIATGQAADVCRTAGQGGEMRWPPTCDAESEADLSTDSGSGCCMIDDLLNTDSQDHQDRLCRWLRPGDAPGHM